MSKTRSGYSSSSLAKGSQETTSLNNRKVRRLEGSGCAKRKHLAVSHLLLPLCGSTKEELSHTFLQLVTLAPTSGRGVLRVT